MIIAAFGAPAGAQPSPAAQISNLATGRCLDTNDSGEVYTSACDGRKTQQWQVSGPIVRNAYTDECLANLESSNGVRTGPCDGSGSQNWLINGRVIHNLLTHRCLETNDSGAVYTMAHNTWDYQNWRFTPVS